MAFTYDITTSRGKVRFYCGDNNTNTYLLEDAEIDFLLSENNSNIKRTAAAAVNAMIAELIKDPTNKTIGNISLSYGDRISQLRELEQSLKADNHSSLSPYCGGISISGKETYTGDSDIVQPTFSRNFMSDTEEEDED